MNLLLEWIVTASLLILVVVILRALLKKRISARLRYALWAVVLARLLIPVQLFPSPVPGMGMVFPADTTLEASQQEPQEMWAAAPMIPEPVSVQTQSPAEPAGILLGTPGKGTSAPSNTPSAPAVAPSPAPTRLTGEEVLRILGWVWAVGAAGAFLVFLTTNFAFYRRLRRVRRPLELEEERRALPVYTAPGLSSPCLFGLIRPAVYVPASAAEDPAMLRHMLAHETTHFRHMDHIWNLLRCFALAIHWWNPLVWLAVALSRRDGELACDEGALKRLGSEERAAYGRTLLTLVTAKPTPVDLLSCATTMSGSKRGLRERIGRIAKTPRRLLAATLAAVLLLSAAAVCAFGRSKAPERDGEAEATFPLAIREHLVAGGASDYYAVREDGTLVMWGEPDSGQITVSTEPIELMQNVAAVYAGPRSAVLAVDRDGGLWSVNHAFRGGDAFDPEEPMKPYQVEGVDQVAMASVGQFHSLVLMQDGALWVDGFGSFGAPWLQQKGNYFVQVMENVIWAEVSGSGGYAVTADHALWGWGLTGDAGKPQKLREDVAMACYGWVLTTDGRLFRNVDDSGTAENEEKCILEHVISIENGMALQEDGSLWVWNEGVKELVYLRGGVRCASLGEFGAVARLENGELWFQEELQTLLDGSAYRRLGKVLRGQQTFYYINTRDGKRQETNIAGLPALFDDPYAKIWNITVVDLDQDGNRELVLRVAGVSNDSGGYVALTQRGGEVYGFYSDYRTFGTLKTNGTFSYSDPTGGREMGWARMGFQYPSDGRPESSLDKFLYATARQPYEFDQFYAYYSPVSREEYDEAEAQQRAKEDVSWYEFNEEAIDLLFPVGTDVTMHLDADGNVVIRGTVEGVQLVRGAVWYSTESGLYPQGTLSMAYPPFRDGIEGFLHARWDNDAHTAVTIDTQGMALLSSYHLSGFWEFTVDLSGADGQGTVTQMTPSSTQQGVRLYPRTIFRDEAVQAARIAAELMTRAEEDYAYRQNYSIVVRDVSGVPRDVLSLAASQVQEQYETFVSLLPNRRPRTEAKFDRWRIDAIEGPWKGMPAGIETEVWRLGYSYHTTTPEEATALLAGGMTLSQDGWMTPTDRLSFLVFCRKDGGLEYTMTLETGPGVGSEPEQIAFWEQTALRLKELGLGKADAMPTNKPLAMTFSSGAGGWCTELTIDPDGSFTGEYIDSDMGVTGPGYQATQYICQFHGRFRDVTRLTAAAWSLTLDSLELDTGHPVGEEWIEDQVRYISSVPYGLDTEAGDRALEPGAKFVLYSPEAKGYAPGDELYGMNGDTYGSELYAFWGWWPDKSVWTPDSTLGCWGLRSVETGNGFFGDEA